MDASEALDRFLPLLAEEIGLYTPPLGLDRWQIPKNNSDWGQQTLATSAAVSKLRGMRVMAMAG